MSLYEPGSDAGDRLEQFVDRIAGDLRDHRRRASFAAYAMGLLTDGERKSVEPMAARASGGEDGEAQRAHDRLLHFVGDSEWTDEPVRLEAVRYALQAIEKRGERVEAAIIDDTGFIKQGKHSPGVQRQYTGSAGKTTNCQIGVSLTLATASTHLPVDMQLYLPTSWTGDTKRRAAAKIPEELTYRSKWWMALLMLERAQKSGLPIGAVLADSAYGNVAEFRAGLRWLGLEYGVAIQSTTSVMRPTRNGQRAAPQSAMKLAKSLPLSAYRTVTWRQGACRAMASRFALVRVIAERSKTIEHPEEILLIEWPKNEEEPTGFTLVRLDRQQSNKQIVRLVKQRWRTERVYEDMKNELGLDHFEGRSYRGWNHHVTLAICCYAFICAEQARHFSLTTRGASGRGAFENAA